MIIPELGCGVWRPFFGAAGQPPPDITLGLHRGQGGPSMARLWPITAVVSRGASANSFNIFLGSMERQELPWTLNQVTRQANAGFPGGSGFRKARDRGKPGGSPWRIGVGGKAPRWEMPVTGKCPQKAEIHLDRVGHQGTWCRKDGGGGKRSGSGTSPRQALRVRPELTGIGGSRLQGFGTSGSRDPPHWERTDRFAFQAGYLSWPI